MDYFKKIKEAALAILPKEAEVSSIDFEGPEIAIYTKNPKIFFENEALVAKLAFELKKHINIRTDKSLLCGLEEAKEKIMQLVPEEAEIKKLYFNAAFSEVVIEASKPGLVIGKNGETSKQIILQTGWTPNIIRAPTSKSKILAGIREFLHKHANERKKFLHNVAKHIYRDVELKKLWVRLHALGSFREVGRSCLLLETPISKVMIDCGINVANPEEAYPYLDALDFSLSELDAVIISHAHLDHCGMLPYLFRAGYKGPVYCTTPTRDLMALLQFDYIDVLVKEGKEPPYSEKDVKESVKHCIVRNYREVTDITPDIRLTLHNAAHILGSASIHLHIGEGAHNIVYTADFKYGFTRLFDNVDMKYPRLETLIIESTYGSKEDILPRRIDAEEKLIQIIRETVQTGGNVLIPVFSVGRAQEVMLVLENHNRKEPLNARVYIDGMTKEASAIHTAYPEFLRKTVQRRILQNDSPFTAEIFHEANSTDRDKIIEEGSAIILASSGMLTGGPSVEYLHKMASNPDNTLIFVGYQGEGSLGRKIQQGLRTIPYVENGKTKALEIKMRVETVEGFSGHSDRNELTNYVRNLKPKPKRILVCHGNKNKCIEFARYIGSKFRINSIAPQNLDAFRLY